MADWFQSTVFSGSLLLALPVAAVAGLVSFFSPCVVPLLPGYLSYATGLSGADLESARRGRMVLGSVLFVLGFTFVFVSLGTLSGALGDLLWEHMTVITRILGVVTILVGVAFLGLVPWFQRDVRIHRVPAVGLAAAPLLGVLFGLGWTPCIGPTLTAVQTLAFAEGTAARGALLSVAYSLGLGLPFILAGLMWRRMLGAVGWIRRHQIWVTRAGGIMLVVVGLLLVTGVWDLWVGRAARLGRRLRGGRVTSTDTTAAAGAGGAARNPTPPSTPPALRPVELARWTWRQLTSMRTALVLLFLLALAAVPGSVVPQRDIDAIAVSEWQTRQPHAGTGLRLPRALLGLRLGVVLRDLPAADGLSGRLRAAEAADLLAGDAGDASGGATQPRSAAAVAHLAGRRPCRRDAGERRRGAAQAALPGRAWPTTAGRSRASGATSARPATWSSTSRSWWCWWPSPSVSSTASRVA